MKDFKIDETIRIQSGFVIPNQYFDNLFDKVYSEIQIEPKVVPIFRNVKFWMMCAAAVFVVVFSVFIFQNNVNKIDSNLENIAFEESLTIEEIAEQLSEKDIAALEVSLQITDVETKNIINEYL